MEKMNYTYIDVLTEISAFFKRHKMVNSFVGSELYDFNASDNLYSAVVLVPTASNISNTQLNLNFDLYFVDRLIEGNFNSKDVYNDELSIALDFISYFSNRNMKWNLEEDNISLEPFYEKFDDIVAGWRLSCVVKLPFRKNVCEIPLDE